MEFKPGLADQIERVLDALEQLLPKATKPIDWSKVKAANWRRHSFSGYLEPIERIETTHLEDLIGIERQKRILERNTQQFLRGFPANNALLWGSRGTGKSSLIRAMLFKYASSGLRIVQVDRHDLDFLPDIFSQIANFPYRFLILCDDLSFAPDDPDYKILKSVLDGSVYAPPENVLIYVTSNRRHLLPEFHTDNLGTKIIHDEIHHGEAVEEKISLSDRFGLWLSFYVFKQEQYLEIVKKTISRLSKDYGIEPRWDEELSQEAVKWSHDKSKRCGRTALQFARYWVGRYLLEREE